MCSLRSAQLLVVLALLATTGCDGDSRADEAKSDPQGTPSSTVSAVGAKPGRFVQPPRRTFDSNPLRLPVQAVSVAEGARVYAPSREALEGARRGRTLVLRFATAFGVDGGNVLVRVGRAPPYPVHPGYVVVPAEGRLRRGSYVIAPYRRQLRHAIVTGIKKEQVTVRYTDVLARVGERRLRLSDVAPQPEGLRPGNYAVFREGQRYRHVLLVSEGTWADGKKRWLALGYAAEALLVDHNELRPMSLDYDPDEGDAVWVSWLGHMVPATVAAVETRGLYLVERPRFAGPLRVGPDLLLRPPEAAK